MIKIGTSFLVLMLLSFSSCNKVSQKSDLNCDGESKLATLTDRTGLDGCQWLLQLADSSFLEPINLNDFDLDLKEGEKICITYVAKKDMASICMAGTIVELKSVQSSK